MNILKAIWFIFAIALTACGNNEPPPINTKIATLDELKAYYQLHCQEKFKMHPYCIDVLNEKNLKTDALMRKKPGSLSNLRSPDEIFRKKQNRDNK